MESKFIIFLCVSLFISSFRVTCTTASTTPPQKPLKFSMKPIHRKSPRPADLPEDFRADARPNLHNIAMLVNISIGNPPVQQLLLMDTASDIMWTQCSDCAQCFKQADQLYNPLKSSTFQKLSCDSKLCHSPLKCSFAKHFCYYNSRYQDGSYSQGYIGTERLTYRATDGQTATVDGMVFGCGLKNNMTPGDGGESGIMGLSANDLSLATQNGRKFSYCIGDLSDDTYNFNQLIIGEGAKMLGNSTPLDIYEGKYYLALEGISVGDYLLNLDPEIFKRSFWGFYGGVILDSGTTVTYLPTRAYKALKDRLSQVIDPLMERTRAGDDLLCYYGTLSQFIPGFPSVYLHFAGGTDLALDKTSLFYEHDEDNICLAMRPVEEYAGRFFIGLLAQQFYNVGFDPDAKKVYFKYGDCTL